MPEWTPLPKYLHSIIDDSPDSVLFETSRFDESNTTSYLFLNPVQVLTATNFDDLPSLFAQIETALVEDQYVAGFLSYECGYHFDRFDVSVPIPLNTPLAWFGVYSRPFIFNHGKGCFEGEAPYFPLRERVPKVPTRLTDRISLTISADAYRTKIQQIHDLIAAGDSYQVNFTDKVLLETSIPPALIFELLMQHQPVSYGAFIHAADSYVLSLSPELFFRTEHGRIITRPMKGTMPRGRDAEEDAMASFRLQNDEKNRSEHVMIVDLIRNDLGRVCATGSVKVEDIFSVERYKTLLQMTSTISGTLMHGLTYYEIFRRIFPSGSITGAPKIRTMEIIRQLEGKPRGVYSGSIGFMAPDGRSAFNVAIRTLVVKDGLAEMGVGGGIVADSTAEKEYEECLLKAAFLTREHHDFQLVETMLWDNGFYLLSLHLERLKSSAAFFGFAFDEFGLTGQLNHAASVFVSGDRHRVKLVMASSGQITISSSFLANPQHFSRARLSSSKTHSLDVYLRHKTTRRELYEKEYAYATSEGFDEVIFTNERGEVTEGAISNIFVRFGDEYVTPPLHSGVLPGVYRKHLLQTLSNAKERTLTIEDLESADTVYLCNSVRGIDEVRFLELRRTPQDLSI